MNMHRTHSYTHDILKQVKEEEGSSYSFPGAPVPYVLPGEKTQNKDPFIQCFFSSGFHSELCTVGKTVFSHITHSLFQSDKGKEKALEKLNEYTITIILTMNYMMGIFYEL